MIERAYCNIIIHLIRLSWFVRIWAVYVFIKTIFFFLISYACSCIVTLSNLWILEFQLHETVQGLAKRISCHEAIIAMIEKAYCTKTMHIYYTHPGLLGVQYSECFLRCFLLYHGSVSSGNLSTSLDSWILGTCNRTWVYLGAPLAIKS